MGIGEGGGPSNGARLRVARGTALGAAIGAAVALAISATSLARYRAGEPTLWQQARYESSQDVAIVIAILGGALVLSVTAWWLRRSAGQTSGWRRALTGAVALLTTALALALFGLGTSTVDPVTVMVAVAAALLGLVPAILARSAAWQPTGRAIALAAVAFATILGASAWAIPYARHQVPSKAVIDWWAAHRNPPLGLLTPVGELEKALERQPREADAVATACAGLADASAALAGPPSAPESLRDNVTRLSADLVEVAHQCEANAGTLAVEDLRDDLARATTSLAAQRIDDVLEPWSVSLAW